MRANSLLRKQVLAEEKRKNYVFFTFLLLSMAYIIGGLVFGDAGYFQYQRLQENRATLERNVADLKAENERMRDFIASYGNNEFYAEKHAREDFGLARPDEYIFIFKE